MKIKLLVGVLVLLILINLATIGTHLYLRFFRHEGGPPGHLLPPGHMPPMMEQMSEEQRHKLFALMDSFHEETDGLRKHTGELEGEAFKLLQQNPVQQEKVDAKLKELADVRLEISRKAVEKMIEAKSFLTPEQQQHFFDAVMSGRPPGQPPHGGPGFRRHDSMGFPPPMGGGEPPPPPPGRDREE
jgi:Spy/CpxP family protein refolding chaperone